MSEIGNVKVTDVKRGNSGLDPKTFDVNKELLDAMRIIAKQEIAKASRDITKNALVRSVNTDGTVNITLEGKEFNKIPNYTVGTVKANDVVKVTYPQNQASNMYISGGTSIDEIIKNINNDINLINSTLTSQGTTLNTLSNSINSINTNLSYKYFASEGTGNNVLTLINNLKNGHGQCGSVSLTSSTTVGSVTVNAGWYNFLWVPHRSGGTGGDNNQYGTLVLFPMTFSNVSYICRYANEQVASIKTFG